MSRTITVEVVKPTAVQNGTVEIQPGAKLVLHRGLGETLAARGLVKVVKPRAKPKAKPTDAGD